MRTRTAALFAALDLILASAFLIWVFSLHGVIGLLRVEPIFRAAFVFVACLGILPGVLLLSGRRLGRVARPGWVHIPVVVVGSLGMVVSVSAFAYLNGVPFSPAPNIPPRLLVAGNSGVTGIPDIAVISYSSDHVKDALTWGNAGTQSVIEAAGSSQQHVFTLRDLEPGMEYWYRIGDGITYRFSTPSTVAGLRFAVGGDAHFGAGDNRKDLTVDMLSRIADPGGNYDYFFCLGDLVDLGFRDGQWNDALRTLSTTLSGVPAVFVAGNHDTMFTGLRRYVYHNSPSGTGLDTGAPLWRRFDVGRIHFLSVDLEWSAESFTDEQAAWLEGQLKSIPTEDWTIVLSHGFYYASGSVINGWPWYDNPETIARVTPLFEKYGVDVVFSSHNHQMELLERNGVTYVMAGSLGGVPDPARTYVSPASLWYAGGGYGYADVTIQDSEGVIVFRNAAGDELRREDIHK